MDGLYGKGGVNNAVTNKEEQDITEDTLVTNRTSWFVNGFLCLFIFCLYNQSHFSTLHISNIKTQAPFFRNDALSTGVVLVAVLETFGVNGGSDIVGDAFLRFLLLM
jgi:hypothetical protein